MSESGYSTEERAERCFLGNRLLCMTFISDFLKDCTLGKSP